jgi:dolichyl-phosphate beta-glucosyltransferase
MKPRPILSIVIPLHNEATRLPMAMTKLAAFKVASFPGMEVVLIENGSIDSTLDQCLWYANRFEWVHVGSVPTAGKGLAVKFGMSLARGLWLYMADVDFSTPLKELAHFVDALQDADIVIGSRELDRSLVSASLKRRIIGRVFHRLVGGLVPGVLDTQCGFKLFRASAAADLFPRLTLSGFAFDVELLWLARQRGYRVKELPVEWRQNSDSRVRLGLDSALMLRDVLSIYLRMLKQPVKEKAIS